MTITVETNVRAPLAAVWRAWTTPTDIMQWNTAREDWHTPAAVIDLREGGAFAYRMAAKDGSTAFDFEGIFTMVRDRERIEFDLGDGRPVTVEFIEKGQGVTVRQTFEAEDEHAGEQQRQGWQAILDNFKRHVEAG